MANTACRDYDRFTPADRSLFLTTFKMLMARDPRVLVHMKKLQQAKLGKLFPNFSEFWATRVNRELRVILTPTAGGLKVIGLARKGGQIYDSER